MKMTKARFPMSKEFPMTKPQAPSARPSVRNVWALGIASFFGHWSLVIGHSLCISFLLASVNAYYGEKDGSRMYGHGIITLMLSEMIGMGVDADMDKLIRQRLQKAVDLILRSQRVQKDQRNKGGWRYTPDSDSADLSVTIWQ